LHLGKFVAKFRQPFTVAFTFHNGLGLIQELRIIVVTDADILLVGIYGYWRG
jgi:hypothetical protein